MYGEVKNIFRSYVSIPGILQTGSKCSLLTMKNNCVVHLSNADLFVYFWIRVSLQTLVLTVPLCVWFKHTSVCL